jgi:transcriptional regulator with XRE-family HTH domain
MSNLADRVKQCMAETGNTPASVATYIGIKAPSIYDWLNGTTKNLSGMNLIRAAQLFNVQPEWLQSGTGDRWESPSSRQLN